MAKNTKELFDQLTTDLPEYLKYLEEKEKYDENMKLIELVRQFPVKKEPSTPIYEWKVPSPISTIKIRLPS